ncbi:hypothetical protein [Lysobacter gummosus]|uniref:hypothetical protein n=1 Tax=Lysobacter gummosus TaxID=262324 RepID=UPI0036288DDD
MVTVLAGLPVAPIPNPESRIPNPESPIPNPQSRIPNPESRIPNPESRIPNPESRKKTTAPFGAVVVLRYCLTSYQKRWVYFMYTKRPMSKLPL